MALLLLLGIDFELSFVRRGFGKSTKGVRPQDHAYPKKAAVTEPSKDKKN